LGSNLGARGAQLGAATDALECLLGPLRIASLYESEALVVAGEPLSSPPPFLNTAVVADDATTDDPEILLAIAKRLELAAGRERAVRWAPRRLDIDLLLVGDQTASHAALTLPHPALRQRAFVLVPLAEIAPELRVPPDGVSVGALAAALATPARLTRRQWVRAER